MILSVLRPLKRFVLRHKPVDTKFDVWRLSGLERTSQQPLSMIYAGLERHKNYMTNLAFTPEPSEEYLGKLKAEHIAEHLASNIDLITYEVSGPKAASFHINTDFAIPMWSKIEMPLLPSPLRRKEFSEVRGKIKKHGYGYELSVNPVDLKSFYEHFYKPYISKTHTETAYIEPLEELEKHFNNGELLYVTKDGKRIAGILIAFEDVPRLCCRGINQDGEGYVQQKLSGALYFFVMTHLLDLGYKKANLGYCRGFLTDGPLRFKAGLGATVSDQYHQESGTLRYQLLRSSIGAQEFLYANPFIDISEGILKEVYFGQSITDNIYKNRHCSGIACGDVYDFANNEIIKIGSINFNT